MNASGPLLPKQVIPFRDQDHPGPRHVASKAFSPGRIRWFLQVYIDFLFVKSEFK